MARRKKKTKGRPGFSFKCRPLMSFKEWERRVKSVKKSNPNVNPYAIVNSSCRKSRRRRKTKRRKKR